MSTFKDLDTTGKAYLVGGLIRAAKYAEDARDLRNVQHVGTEQTLEVAEAIMNELTDELEAMETKMKGGYVAMVTGQESNTRQ